MSPASTQPNVLKRCADFWLAPVEARRMRWFECLFTLTFLISLGRCFMEWREWLTVAGFHLQKVELQSMGYPESWPLLVGWQAAVFAVMVMAGSVSLLLNWWRRAALILLFGCALYAQRVDYMVAFTLNKLYVGIYALLALGPGMWRDQQTDRLMQCAAPMRVIQATLILQYFAAGLAKVDGDWLKSGDLLWGHVQGVYRTEIAAWALRTLPRWAWTAQQHGSLAFELLAPLLFTVRRLRWLALSVGFGFHLIIALMMKDLIFFSLQMWTFYALFWPEKVKSE